MVLPDVGIVYGKKLKTISGKGMLIPGTSKVPGETSCILEFGIITNADRDYSVEKVIIPVKECTYTTCKLNLRFYDITDGRHMIISFHRREKAYKTIITNHANGSIFYKNATATLFLTILRIADVNTYHTSAVER